jgi:tetratricopeptide (TPR) repeat protein
MQELNYEESIERARWLWADTRDRSRIEPNAREAARMVREILSRWPDDYDANSLMGAILADLDEFDESIKYLDRAIQINPSDSLAYGHKAGTLLAKGDLAAAEAYARKELELIDPADETIDTTYDSLSVILREQGRLDEAQQVLKDGIAATGSDLLRERLAALECSETS